MKLQKLNSSGGPCGTHWHGEAVQLLKDNFGKIHSAFTDATKRAVWMGMFLNHIKARGKADESIPHGEFGPWLEKNVPEISRTQINVYMDLAKGVCEKGKFEINGFRDFAQLGQLPPAIEKIVEGKTQEQLKFSFGGGKAEKSEPSPKTKLSPMEQHAALLKNIEAAGQHALSGLEFLLQMNLPDLSLMPPVILAAIFDNAAALKLRVQKKK